VEETKNQAHRDLIDEAFYLRGRITSAKEQLPDRPLKTNGNLAKIPFSQNTIN
jgi:hypothetical protein